MYGTCNSMGDDDVMVDDEGSDCRNGSIRY